MAVELPCLDSSPDCVNRLSEEAIAHNAEIARIDERLELVGRQIDRQYERRWTAVLPALGDLLSLNPVRLVESLFGGGGVRDADLKLAELQVRVSDLVRRRAEVTVQLHEQVLGLVLEVERGDRQIELLRSQLERQRQRVALMEIGYRLGQGSTLEMIGVWQQTENLEAQVTEAQVQRDQEVRWLLQVSGCEVVSEVEEGTVLFNFKG